MTNPTPMGARVGALADLKAGALVFLIALPLCLGISRASGFPPIAGVLTAIVGGLLVSLLGSSRLTIKGPAAGLIVIVVGAVTELGMQADGQVDLSLGYHRTLAVGVVAAALQIGFALLRTATIGIAMSPSVVHGMLAAIGVIIIAKQSQFVFGATAEGDPLQLLAQLPDVVANANVPIAAIGVGSLAILFAWPRFRPGWARAVPPQLVVLAFAVPLGAWFGLSVEHDVALFGQLHHVDPHFLVALPDDLADAIQLPDWSAVTSGASLKYIVMLALVGTIESTLSVIAVDSLDPEKRASDLNRDLLATGVGNLVVSLIGGLPMISEIVRSKANIDAGARSGRANFAHGLLLLVFVVAAPGLLHSIPLAALGAMLVHTGSRLASPREFHQAYRTGPDQLLLFTTTLGVTLISDLLVGVATGLLLKISLHLVRGAGLGSLFRTRIERHPDGTELRLIVHGAAAFTALLPLRKILSELDDQITTVRLDLSECAIVDHTFLIRVHGMADELRHATLEVVGTEDMRAASSHRHSSRRRIS